MLGFAQRGEILPTRKSIEATYGPHRALWDKLLKSGRVILFINHNGRVAMFPVEGISTAQPKKWNPHHMLDHRGRHVMENGEWVGCV